MGWGRDRDISLQGFSGHAFISLLRISLLRIHYGQVQFLIGDFVYGVSHCLRKSFKNQWFFMFFGPSTTSI